VSLVVSPPDQHAFDVDFDEVFAAISADIATVRKSRELPPLVPEGAILVGAEYSGQEQAPPRIVVIPTGARYAPARRVGKENGTFGIGNANPPVFWLQWLTFRAECWGSDDPRGKIGSSLYSFSSALELARELLGALTRQVGGVPNVQIDGAEFNQPRDINRFGRLYVVNFAIGTSVTDERWTTAAPVTAGVTITATSPDGSSTQTEAQFTAP
jgi:hypothetical protein